MKSLNQGICFLLILFFAINGLAQTVSLPTQVPSQTNWTLTLDLQPYNFDKVNIELNGVKVASVFIFGNQQAATEKYSVNVNQIEVNDNIVQVTFTGITVGTHSVSVKSYNNNELANFNSYSVTVFNAVSESFKVEATRELNELKKLNEQLREQIQTYKTSLEALNQTVGQLNVLLIEKEQNVETLRTTLRYVNEQVNILKQETQTMKTEDLNKIEEQINKIQEGLNKSEQQAQGLAGLFVLPNIDPTLATLIVIAILVLLIVFYFIRKSQDDDLFTSTPADSINRAYKEVEKEKPAKTETSSEETENNPGKWAHEKPETKTESEKRGFGIGDLIKRE
ncbi:MAG: hypothetical protein Q7S92_05280 [Candidatus Diapherotrites archaeon]|nr:hypothetical protein [Candidatus Diapherotrites archaeon]